MSEPLKWWSVVPVGATLIEKDTMKGHVVFRWEDDETPFLACIDLWTDDVIWAVGSV